MAAPATATLSLEEIEARDPALHRARSAYFALLLFTILLYARPSDIIPPLRLIPLAQIAAMMAIAAYGFAVIRGQAPLIMTTELKLVLGLTFFFTMSVPFAFWRSRAFEILYQDWLKTLIIFFLLSQLVFTTDRVRKLLWAMILCMLFVSAYSLVQRPAMDSEGRMRGAMLGFFSGNYLGIAVAVMLPYIAVLLVSSRSIIKSLVLVSTFGLVMLMTVKTASRGNMICVIISLLLVWALILRDSAKARLMGVAFVLAIVVAVLVAPGVFWDRLSTMWDKESYSTSAASLSAEQSEMQRKTLLMHSIKFTFQNPVFGLGLGNFPIVNGTVTRDSQSWKGTHNTYTEVSSEAGIPAFLLFVALLITSIRSMRRIHQQCHDRPELAELSLLARATQVSILSFMLAGFFAHLAYDYYLYYLAGFGVALQAVYDRVKDHVGPAPAAGNGKPTYGRNEGVGRLRGGSGVRGRAW